MNNSDLTFVAIQAALQAGEILRRGFNTKHHLSYKNDGVQNLVTEYDTLSEKCIIDFIRTRFPKHGFLAEEGGSSHENAEVVWVIDPLDGTVNFARSIPVFTVSIAAAVHKEFVTGVVYQPITQELFVAEKNKGAYLNGQKLQVSNISSFDGALLTTGFPYNVNENPECCIDRFAKIASYGVPIRRLGSAALDLCYVAAGRFDAHWELSLSSWDIAAGKLIIEESGGKVTQYDGSPHTVFKKATLLATNGLIHNKLIEELTRPI